MLKVEEAYVSGYYGLADCRQDIYNLITLIKIIKKEYIMSLLRDILAISDIKLILYSKIRSNSNE